MRTDESIAHVGLAVAGAAAVGAVIAFAAGAEYSATTRSFGLEGESHCAVSPQLRKQPTPPSDS